MLTCSLLANELEVEAAGPQGPGGTKSTLLASCRSPWPCAHPLYTRLQALAHPLLLQLVQLPRALLILALPRDHLLCKAVISLLKNSFLVSLPQGCPLWEGRKNICEGTSLVPCLMLPGAGALASTMFLTRSRPHSLLCRGVTSVWTLVCWALPFLFPLSHLAPGEEPCGLPTLSLAASSRDMLPTTPLGEAAVVWLCSSGLDRYGK